MTPGRFAIPLCAAAALCLAAGRTVAAPASATSGDFTASEVLTTDPEGFVAAWNREGPRSEAPADLRLLSGKEVTPFILFKGCRPNAEGACKVKAEIRIVDPDGKPSDPADFEVWGDPPLPKGLMMRSAKAPRFGFEAGDPPGRYLLRARVTDEVAGVEVVLEAPLAYGDAPAG